MPRDFSRVTPLDELRDAITHHFLARPIYRRHARRLDLTGGERVLEFGAGSGALSRHLAPMLAEGGRLVCLDTSEPWVAVARKRLRGLDNVEFVLGDVLELDLPEGSFDAVVIHWALHEVEPERRGETLRELARLLSDGGRLFVSEPTREEHGIPADGIRRLMSEAGLREVSSEEHRPFLLPPSYEGAYVKGG